MLIFVYHTYVTSHGSTYLPTLLTITQSGLYFIFSFHPPNICFKKKQKTLSSIKDPKFTKMIMNLLCLTMTFSSYSSIKNITILFMPGNFNSTNRLSKYLTDLCKNYSFLQIAQYILILKTIRGHYSYFHLQIIKIQKI